MLETQRSSKYQSGDCRNLANAPLAFDGGNLVSSLLPEPSDVSCGSSGVAADEISWSNGSGDVGAFGKVLTLVAGCEDAAVTAGSWSSPSGYLATFGGYGQCPASVDELYGTPANLVLSHPRGCLTQNLECHIQIKELSLHQSKVLNKLDRA